MDARQNTSARETAELWPPLPYEEWKDTYDTLHMWTQIVGKVRMELSPFVNHWWHVTLYVTPRGLALSYPRSLTHFSNAWLHQLL